MSGEIVTFYSFKGGVGRTLALANIATLLARWGYRVLCVDWDLEAPGLDAYFDLQGDQAGIVDLATAVGDGDLALWEPLVRQTTVVSTEGRLHLLSAGAWASPRYSAQVQGLDWARLYDEHELGQVLENFRAQWIEAYDFTLIDSRTGLTDIGGICTVQLPDVVVGMFTANNQSVNGVLTTMRRANAAREALEVDRGRLRILPIASRFEGTVEVDLAHRWMEHFVECLPPLLSSWAHRELETRDLLVHLTVPYIAHWSFGEQLPVIEEGTANPTSIGYAFETLTALIANHLERSELLVRNRQAFVDAAQSPLLGGSTAYDLAITSTSGEEEFVAELVDALGTRGLRVAVATTPARATAMVVVVGRGRSNVVDDVVQEFLVAGGGLVIPVVRGDDEWAVPPSLHGFQRIDGHAATVDSIADQVWHRLLERAISSSQQKFGTDAPQTLAAMAELARAWAKAGADHKATTLWQIVFDRRQAVLGADHPDTRASAEELERLTPTRSSEPDRLVFTVARDTIALATKGGLVEEVVPPDLRGALKDAGDSREPAQAGEALFHLLVGPQFADAWATARRASAAGGQCIVGLQVARVHDTVTWETLRDPRPPATNLAVSPDIWLTRLVAGPRRWTNEPIHYISDIGVSLPGDASELSEGESGDHPNLIVMDVAADVPAFPYVFVGGQDSLEAHGRDVPFALHLSGYFDAQGVVWPTEPGVLSRLSADALLEIVDGPWISLMVLRGQPLGRAAGMLAFARALVGSGVPAVVVIPSDLSDESATGFLFEMYSLLTRGRRIEEAVNAGRAVLRRRTITNPTRWDFALPVLYTAD